MDTATDKPRELEQSPEQIEEIQRRAADVAHELTYVASIGVDQAERAIKQIKPHEVDKPPGNIDYTATETRRLGHGRVGQRVSKTSKRLGSTASSEAMPEGWPIPGRDTVTTTEYEGLSLRPSIRPKIDEDSKKHTRTSTVKTINHSRNLAKFSLKTPDEIAEGQDVIFTEDVKGDVRDVRRTVRVSYDSDQKPVIEVTQTSTDINGENPRQRVWRHTQRNPSEIAVRTAHRVGRRVADAQPSEGKTKRKKR